MSQVPSEARGKQKLKVLTDARSLCRYSLNILQNNRHFKVRPTGDEEDDTRNPPQPELVAKIRETVLDAYISAFSANETVFTKDNYRHRRQLQDRSIAKLNELLALIELSIPVFHTDLRRVEYWTGCVKSVRGQVQTWKESDYRRFKRM